MNWQQPVSLAVVAITGFLFVRHEIRVRKRARNRACGSGDCGCGETGGWKWPLFQVAYMTALAYGVTFIVYSAGIALGLGG